MQEAVAICNNISALGFKNRGVKDGSDLYVIKKTKAQAILIECCFVDSKTDTSKYNAYKIAESIYKAIK
jgi:N-acetylmuramoyl-L-alanine amidase